MQPISAKDKQIIAREKYYRSCVICGSNKVQIHHVFIYAGKQIKELWNYQPICEQHHHESTPHNVKYKPKIRELSELKCLERVDRLYLKTKYPKKDWLTLYKYLCTLNL